MRTLNVPKHEAREFIEKGECIQNASCPDFYFLTLSTGLTKEQTEKLQKSSVGVVILGYRE